MSEDVSEELKETILKEDGVKVFEKPQILIKNALNAGVLKKKNNSVSQTSIQTYLFKKKNE